MDIDYLLFLQNLRDSTNDIFNSFFAFVTHMGETSYILLICTLIYWSFNKKSGLFAMFSLNLGFILNGLFKAAACVYRPWIRDSRIIPMEGAKTTATGYSFPSGHSTNASSFFGVFVYESRKKKIISVSLIILILLVFFSRNYLGVHTPQDVICGMFTGIICIIAAKNILSWVEKGENRDFIVLAAGLAATLSYIIFITCKSYPMDYIDGKPIVDYKDMLPDSYDSGGAFAGFLCGWLFERRFVKFKEPKSLWKSVARYLPGILLTFILYLVFNETCAILFGKLYGRMICKFIVMLFITGIYPLIFKKIEKGKDN